jgi:hypothetical protein
VGLDLDGTVALAAGTVLTAESLEVGRVTSAAMWDARVSAIGFVRSDAHDGATIEAGRSTATVRAL